jgi:hypothetical protein
LFLTVPLRSVSVLKIPSPPPKKNTADAICGKMWYNGRKRELRKRKESTIKKTEKEEVNGKR